MNLYFRFKQKHNSIFERLNIEENEIFKNLISDDRKEIESELLKHEQFMSVLKALKMLPVKYQEAIALRYFEGKENREIAEIMNINEGTLKSLLSRGIEKLRQKCNQI
jgi:RNA polymerase sigma-70 factor (ECF subfamily)